MSSQNKHNAERLPQLDAMRGVAALWVVIFHWFIRYQEIYPSSHRIPFDIPDGRHGVHLFFMISGFVILMSLDKISRVRDFVVFRFSRLYPTLWACAGITFLLVTLFGLPGREVSIKDAVMNITMIPHIMGFKFIDSVYWSLEVELFFYGLMAFIVAVGARRYLIHILSGLVFLNICFLLMPGDVTKLPGAIKAVRLLFTMRYLHLFLFGILCYEMTRQPRNWYYPLLFICLLVPTSDKIFWTFSRPEGMENLVRVDSVIVTLEDYLLVFILGMLFWFGTQHRVFFLRWRLFLFLGFISYPLYLLHQNIGFIAMRGCSQYVSNQGIEVLIAAIIVFPLAAFVSYYIEHPFNKKLRDFYKKFTHAQ